MDVGRIVVQVVQMTTLSLSCSCGKSTKDIQLTLPEVDRFKKVWTMFHQRPGCAPSAAVEVKKQKEETS
jgi:hypothetical protein